MFKSIEELNMVLAGQCEFERMKNCMNCDHNEVCVVVARRKATKANDYSPCSHWQIIGEDKVK